MCLSGTWTNWFSSLRSFSSTLKMDTMAVLRSTLQKPIPHLFDTLLLNVHSIQCAGFQMIDFQTLGIRRQCSHLQDKQQRGSLHRTVSWSRCSAFAAVCQCFSKNNKIKTNTLRVVLISAGIVRGLLSFVWTLTSLYYSWGIQWLP